MVMNISWMEHASCAGMDAEDFFPKKTGAGARMEAERAQTVCVQCPVQQACHDYAETNRIPFGVWGGRLRSSKAIAMYRPGPKHGTNSGYAWHMRRHQKPCWDCTEAHRIACVAYQRARRKKPA